MFINQYIVDERSGDDWGEFITDFEMSGDAISSLRSGFQSAHRNTYLSVLGNNSVFDEYALLMLGTEFPAEDQCTEQYYFDVFVHLLRNFGTTRHMVEVGCFTGGSSCWLYVASRLFNFTLDIVDPNRSFLAYTHARLAATFGEVHSNVRFFCGDVPTYVERVALVERRKGMSVHHDGAHSFNECVQDFSSLSFVADDLLHLIVQDTDLRSQKIHSYIFVDSALHAVFGDYEFSPIGVQRDNPGQPMWDARIFFDPLRSEGQILDIRKVKFRFPHVQTIPADFFRSLQEY